MKVIRNKNKRGRPRIEYTKREQEFYEKNKNKIIEGLGDYVPKSKIKSTFFGSVKEEQMVNKLSKTQAMNKVLRRREFTTAQENFSIYREEVIEKTFKGQKRSIKSYLGIAQNKKLDSRKLQQTTEGWVYMYGNKSVLLKRSADTKTEGYDLIYA